MLSWWMPFWSVIISLSVTSRVELIFWCITCSWFQNLQQLILNEYLFPFKIILVEWGSGCSLLPCQQTFYFFPQLYMIWTDIRTYNLGPMVLTISVNRFSKHNCLCYLETIHSFLPWFESGRKSFIISGSYLHQYLLYRQDNVNLSISRKSQF